MIERLRPLPWWGRSSLAALAGAAASLGFAPISWWPALVVAIAAHALLMLSAPRGWHAVIAGFVFGLSWNLLSITWLSVIFPGALIGLAALQAAFQAVLGLAVHWSGRTRWWPLLAAGCWSSVEFAFSHQPFNGFPWLRLGYVSVDSPLAGLLPLGGVPLAGLAVALLGLLLAWLLAAASVRRTVSVVLAASLLIGVGWLGGLTPAGPQQGSVSVGYVQGNAPGGGIYGLGEPRTITRNHAAETERLAQRIRSGELPRPAFVVWPENGTDLDPFKDAQTNALVTSAVASAGVPVLVGTITEGPGPNERQTASIVWYPTTGAGERYNKRDLVPFGEWVPIRSILEPLFPIVAYVGAQSVPGTTPGILNVRTAQGTVRVGAAICYEVAYDDTMHDTVSAGGQVIVVQSSNAMYTGTPQVPQQFVITRARAAELRREILVTTTTGTSGLIRPDGSVAFTLPEFTPASGVVELPLRSGVTSAVTVSAPLQWLTVAVTLAGLAAALLAGRPRARLRAGRDAQVGQMVRQNGLSANDQEIR